MLVEAVLIFSSFSTTAMYACRGEHGVFYSNKPCPHTAEQISSHKKQDPYLRFHRLSKDDPIRLEHEQLLASYGQLTERLRKEVGECQLEKLKTQNNTVGSAYQAHLEECVKANQQLMLDLNEERAAKTELLVEKLNDREAEP